MQYNFTHMRPTLPTTEAQTSHVPPKSRKKFIIYAVVAAVLLIALCLFLYLRFAYARPDPKLPAEQSLTLYYRDGKTVLWQSAQQGAGLEAGAPGFVAFIDDELKEKLGFSYRSKGAWHITTTLDGSLQAAAEQQVQSQLAALKARDVQNVALV